MVYQTPEGPRQGQEDILYGDGDGQTSGTVDLMVKYSLADSTHPLIVQRAQSLQTQLPSPTFCRPEEVADVVFRHVKSSMYFIDDAVRLKDILRPDGSPTLDTNIELLQRPVDTEFYIRKGQLAPGDCDDYSMYSSCLLLAFQALGFPVSQVRFVTVAEKGSHEYGHVFVRFTGLGSSPGKAISMDCSHGPYAGWCYQTPSRETEWSIGSNLTTVLTALGLLVLPFLTTHIRKVTGLW